MQLPQIKARLARIEELEKGLAREVGVWQAQEAPLSELERKRYLDAIQNAVAGLDDARATLAAVVKRLEQPGR